MGGAEIEFERGRLKFSYLCNCLRRRETSEYSKGKRNKLRGSAAQDICLLSKLAHQLRVYRREVLDCCITVCLQLLSCHWRVDRFVLVLLVMFSEVLRGFAVLLAQVVRGLWVMAVAIYFSLVAACIVQLRAVLASVERAVSGLGACCLLEPPVEGDHFKQSCIFYIPVVLLCQTFLEI